MKSPPRPRRRKSDPVLASEVVSSVVAHIGGDRRGREQKVFAIYAEIAGEFISRHSRPDALRDKTLVVQVASSAIAHQLTLLRGEILRKMAPLLPAGMVTDLRTRVAKLD